jgi:outer membrane protein TolC
VVPPTLSVQRTASPGLQAAAIRRAVRRASTGGANARIGVATADLYAKFSLPGTIGLESLASNHFFTEGSRAWSLVGNFTWTIFQGGAIRQNIEVQNALQEQTLIQYEATIITALEDVENSVRAFAEEQERREALLEATQAAQRAAESARDQCTSGLIDFQTVLDADRSVLTSQEQLTQSRGQVTTNLISLYKALGGGWKPSPGAPP